MTMKNMNGISDIADPPLNSSFFASIVFLLLYLLITYFAIASISTFAPLGSAATWNAALAGYLLSVEVGTELAVNVKRLTVSS